MPRDVSGLYTLPPGTDAIPARTILSSPYNLSVHDIEADLNAPRPISAGGTGATTASGALAALGADPAGAKATQGRLTLASGVPIMTSTVNGATSVYYLPYTGPFVPLYNGTTFAMTDIGGELSQTLADATKSPAAAVANSNYDYFVWDDAGTKRCTRGPAWTSDTARGAGAGTTELERLSGVLVNKNAISNGPAVRKGTYVGTIRTLAGPSVSFLVGASAVGGSAAFIGIWNMYNRVPIQMQVNDSTASWTYATNAYRPANNSISNRVSFVSGMSEDPWLASYKSCYANSASGACYVQVGFDSTTLRSGYNTAFQTLGMTAAGEAVQSATSIGFHFVQALETSGAGTGTFYGNTAGLLWSWLDFSWRC